MLSMEKVYMVSAATPDRFCSEEQVSVPLVVVKLVLF